MKQILITTGDIDGIGAEITIKALLKIGPKPNILFSVFCSSKNASAFKKKLKKKFSDKSLQLLVRDTSPALWVEEATKLCLNKRAQALVTAPLSKQEIKLAGLEDVGHTDIFKRLSGEKNLFMGFIGSQFNVVLATGHHPIKEVSEKLTIEKLGGALVAAEKLRKLLPQNKKGKPIALLGLNPHASDQGLLGDEEEQLIKPFLKSFPKVKGPLVPDVAFIKDQQKKYSVYVACYHDQGLIPFKMAHGFSGVHVTLGLPFWRSSVDHGTAKDIFGKNKANPASMIEAIQWGIKCSNL